MRGFSGYSGRGRDHTELSIEYKPDISEHVPEPEKQLSDKSGIENRYFMRKQEEGRDAKIGKRAIGRGTIERNGIYQRVSR